MSIPLILDTDIGTDVDDVWALVFLLNCPEVDIKLITTATGDTQYRARIVAKILASLGRTDIPIGVGLFLDRSEQTHEDWLGNYSLSDYPGEVIQDGVGAICDQVLSSEKSPTLLSIGPLPNISAAISRQPEIVHVSRFVGMHGSLRRGYLDSQKPAREYNVRLHALSCRHVFLSDWHKTITPLDSCGNVYLDEERFKKLLDSGSDSARVVLAAHDSWYEAIKDWPMYQHLKLQERSSILFDCVAAYLAFSEEFLRIEELPILVTKDGKTLIDERGKTIRCATDWFDKERFLDMLVERLV